MSKKVLRNFLILLYCLLIGGFVGIIYNTYPEFDFLNYRMYNGWAFLNNRIDIDIMPTTFRTYFNPILDTLNYLLITKLNHHPFIYLYISGFKYGLFTFLSYLIYDLVFVKKDFEKKFLICSTLVLVLLSPIVLYTLAYGNVDMILADFVLLSLYLYLKSIFCNKNIKNSILIIFSAVLLGMATGLKYTQFIYCFAIIVCTMCFHKTVKQPFKTCVLLITGILLGFVITDGFWMYKLYLKFHNPVFPYFNSIFHSAVTSNDSVFLTDFAHLRPQNLFELVFYPLKDTLQENVGFEGAFFDFKIPLTFVLILVYLFFSKVKKIKLVNADIYNPLILDFIILFMVISYYTNAIIFNNIRYILMNFTMSSVIIVVICVYIQQMIYKAKYDCVNVLDSMIIMLFLLTRIPYLSVFNLFAPVVYVIVAVYALYLFSELLKSNSSYLKNVNITVSILVLMTILTYKQLSMPLNQIFYQDIFKICDIHFKSDSNVILATNLTSFIIPKQNSSIRVIGYSVPKKYRKNGYYSIYSKWENAYYTDEFLEEKLKNIFAEKKNLYFVYSSNYDGNGYDKGLFEATIKYYSNGKISRLKNCSSYDYMFFNTYYYDRINVCQLK